MLVDDPSTIRQTMFTFVFWNIVLKKVGQLNRFPRIAEKRILADEGEIPGSAFLSQIVAFCQSLLSVKERTFQKAICLRVILVKLQVKVFVFEETISIERIDISDVVVRADLSCR